MNRLIARSAWFVSWLTAGQIAIIEHTSIVFEFENVPDTEVYDEEYAEGKVHLEGDGILPVHAILKVREVMGVWKRQIEKSDTDM